MDNIGQLFIEASRHAYRFQGNKGQLQVEDLWKLPLNSTNGPSLESVAQAVFAEQQNNRARNFTGEPTPTDVHVDNKLNIVKYVIETVKQENLRIAQRKQVQEQLKVLDNVIQNRKLTELNQKTVEELEEMRNQLKSQA